MCLCEYRFRYRLRSRDKRFVRRNPLREFLFGQSSFEGIRRERDSCLFQQMNRVAVDLSEWVSSYEHAPGLGCLHLSDSLLGQTTVNHRHRYCVMWLRLR